MSEHPAGLWPAPGDGVLARRGNLIILTTAESGDLVDTLLDVLEQLAAVGGDGRRFADAVAEILEAESPSAGAGPSVLAFGPVGDGMAATVCGTAWAEIGTAQGNARIEASQPGMLLRCLLTSPVEGVVGGLAAGGEVEARADRFSRLDAGTVRASGLRYYLAGSTGGPGRALSALRHSDSAAAGAVGTPLAEPASFEPAPAPFEPAPFEPAPFEPAPFEPAPFEPAPFDPGPAPAPALLDVPATGPSDPSGLSSPSMPGALAAATPMATELWSIPAQDQGSSAEPVGGNYEATIAPVGAADFDAVMLVGTGPGDEVELESREPLPMASDLPPGTASYATAAPIIEGVLCQNGHFQDPQAMSCAICGAPIQQQQPSLGPRPPLGMLILDDDSAYQLDIDYIVGREPGLDASVAAGQSRPLRVTDDSGIVSRVHARVQLDGWRVTIIDLGSANGTKVRFPNGAGEQVLTPNVPVVLTSGSEVDLGGREFRYEAHRGG